MRLALCRNDRESGCGQPIRCRLLDNGRIDQSLFRQRERLNENGLDLLKLRLLLRVEDDSTGGNVIRNVTGPYKHKADKPG